MPPKVWFITGTNSGIGLALAHYVLEQGDKVVATVRSLSKFPQSLRDAGARPLELDLDSSDAHIRKVGEDAIQAYGHIDVLVNNAGYGLFAPVEELDMDALRAQFQTNFFGAVLLTQIVLPQMRERKTGHIVNVTSVGAYYNYPGVSAYTASKTAIDAFSESLSREVAAFGIRVVVLVPGYFPSNFFSQPRAEERESTVYTDPNQGFGSRGWTPAAQQSLGHVGDLHKFSARTFEVVHGTGMARELVESGSRDWIRVPLGTDCGGVMREKIKVLRENVDEFEQIWRSTDVEPERPKQYSLASSHV